MKGGSRGTFLFAYREALGHYFFAIGGMSILSSLAGTLYCCFAYPTKPPAVSMNMVRKQRLTGKQ
jgi:hypothetical protein